MARRDAKLPIMRQTATVLFTCLCLMPWFASTARAQDGTGASVRVDPDLIAELVVGVYCAEKPVSHRSGAGNRLGCHQHRA